MSGEALPPDPAERLVRMVHDLRTPITIISGFADLLAKRTDLDEAQRADFLQRIRDGAEELKQILDDERATRPDWS